MASSQARIEVWCEDHAQERFARALLTGHFGLDRRRITFHIAPSGQGSASQWVSLKYRDALRLARVKRHQQRLGFLVIVDGDNVGRIERMRALAGAPDVRPDADRIAIWVPTWSIETWIMWLAKEPVEPPLDEARSIKELANHRGFARLLGAAILGWEPPHREEQSRVPSLTDARREMYRLPLS